MLRLSGTVRALVLSFSLGLSGLAWGESQINDYQGVKDPFGDPSNYEFSEDEKTDKEFFHLGRFFMLGVDFGAGIFTGGLGKTTAPAANFGGRFLFFFDSAVALEGAVHYAYHIDQITTGAGSGSYDVDLIPVTFGLRYYFDTRGAPRAIAIANPYLAGGGGVYMRTLTTAPGGNLTLPGGSDSNFGVYAGAGVEFLVYGSHLYLGADIRYHMIFFVDESDTLNGNVSSGDRAGDYITPLLSLTYNF